MQCRTGRYDGRLDNWMKGDEKEAGTESERVEAPIAIWIIRGPLDAVRY